MEVPFDVLGGEPHAVRVHGVRDRVRRLNIALDLVQAQNVQILTLNERREQPLVLRRAEQNEIFLKKKK